LDYLGLCWIIHVFLSVYIYIIYLASYNIYIHTLSSII
jgi:hypothetical protein